MPFTFSHPAVVLPLAYLPKKWFSQTALVIGSLTPDFEYFLRMRVKSDYSHTIDGLFWFDLPLGLLLTFIFHNIIRDALFDNCPTILKSKFSAFRNFDWNKYFKRNWLLVTISILIGAISHVFWDSFTHNHGYFVNSIPSLSKTIEIFGRHLPIFKILQHTSAIIGGLIVLFAIYKMPVKTFKKEKINFYYWIIIALMISAIIAVRIFSGLETKQYGNLIVTAIAAGMISTIVAPLLMKIKIIGRSNKQK